MIILGKSVVFQFITAIAGRNVHPCSLGVGGGWEVGSMSTIKSVHFPRFSSYAFVNIVFFLCAEFDLESTAVKVFMIKGGLLQNGSQQGSWTWLERNRKVSYHPLCAFQWEGIRKCIQQINSVAVIRSSEHILRKGFCKIFPTSCSETDFKTPNTVYVYTSSEYKTFGGQAQTILDQLCFLKPTVKRWGGTTTKTTTRQ